MHGGRRSALRQPLRLLHERQGRYPCPMQLGPTRLNGPHAQRASWAMDPGGGLELHPPGTGRHRMAAESWRHYTRTNGTYV